MSEQTSVTRQVVVPGSPRRAFDVFTQQYGAVKPPEHTLLDAEHVETTLEPWVGGRIVDRGDDGSECAWARILAFDPPDRFVFSWDIGTTWELETDLANTSEVEVRFTDLGDGTTRVEIEHRHLDRHGSGWESLRDSVDGEQGYPLFLQRLTGLLAAS